MECWPRAACPARTSSSSTRAASRRATSRSATRSPVSSQGGSRQFPLVGVVQLRRRRLAGRRHLRPVRHCRPPRASSASPGGRRRRGQGRRLASPRRSSPPSVQQAMPEGVEVLTGEQITEENQSDIQQGLSVLQHPAAGVRRRGPLRRLVHHLQHLLDHRGPAAEGERAAAGHRRQPAPDPRLAADRVGRHRARRVAARHRARRAHRQAASRRCSASSASTSRRAAWCCSPAPIIVSLIVGWPSPCSPR